MIVSIASGKGGTGKTTLALLLASARPGTTLIDCDVEAPNCHLFLQPNCESPESVSVMAPRIDPVLCTGCGQCAERCLFNAIAVAGKQVMLFAELCHSCGGCLLACRNGAISEGAKTIGTVTTGTKEKTTLITGQLAVGVPSAVPLIKATKQRKPKTGDVIIDCPPGTSCSMVAAVRESDYCILVTEPTPFGRHDLELAIGVIKLLKLPAGVVINKSDSSSGDQSIADLCRQHRIPVLAKIPYSREFAETYARGSIHLSDMDAIHDIWWEIEHFRIRGDCS